MARGGDGGTGAFKIGAEIGGKALPRAALGDELRQPAVIFDDQNAHGRTGLIILPVYHNKNRFNYRCLGAKTRAPQASHKRHRNVTRAYCGAPIFPA